MKRKRTHITTKNNDGRRFPPKHKVNTINEVEEVLVRMGRPTFKFDPEKMVSERILDCWGLPKDDVMKMVIKENINGFLFMITEKEKMDNQFFTDVEKLYLYTEYFDHCVKEGVIMDKYKLLSHIDCLLKQIVSEIDNSTIEKVISEIEMETFNV